MNELMIHVERIVRPIGATQVRKLRMRTELLAHLQAAFEEERLRSPGDEPAAIERAKLRLGDPTTLRRELQETVPFIERVLLGRLALSEPLDKLEKQMACMPGQRGPMTLGHKSILSAMATFAFAQVVLSLLSALASVEMQTAHYLLAVLAIPLGWFIVLVASYRFVFEAASGSQRVDWPGTSKRAVVVLAAQLALMFLIFFAVADRFARLHEITVCFAVSLSTLVISGMVAHYIGMLRRPYDAWLALDITE